MENFLIGQASADDGKPAARMRFSWGVTDSRPLEEEPGRGGGIPLTRGQVNLARPCLAPPGWLKSENSLVFIGRERFWGSGWRPLERPLSVR